MQGIGYWRQSPARNVQHASQSIFTASLNSPIYSRNTRGNEGCKKSLTICRCSKHPLFDSACVQIDIVAMLIHSLLSLHIFLCVPPNLLLFCVRHGLVVLLKEKSCFLLFPCVCEFDSCFFLRFLCNSSNASLPASLPLLLSFLFHFLLRAFLLCSSPFLLALLCSQSSCLRPSRTTPCSVKRRRMRC